MKQITMLAIALGVAIAAPLHAAAAQGGTVCGHVDASPARIAALLSDPMERAAAVVVAKSATSEVQTTIDLSGNYCFSNLQSNLYTLTAIGGDSTFSGSVTPVAGQTIALDLTAQN